MKIVLVGVAGFAAGFMTAAVFAAHTHQQKLDEEIEAIKAEYKAKADEAVENYKEEIESEWERIERENATGKLDDEEPSPEEVEETTIEAAQALIEQNGYTAYNTPVKQPKGPTVSTPPISEIPVKITFEEFDDTPKDYEQYTLTLYMGNNKLVSQSGKVIKGKDLVRTVGDLLGSFEEGKDAIYIRNPKLKMDFEVVRDPKSFEDE